MTKPSALRIIRDIDGFTPELIAFRRDLHMHPEVAFEETRTTEKLVERLREAGLAPRVLSCGTGLICDIVPTTASAAARRTVALRADIDALPVHDLKDVPYRSTVDGKTHACGHDVHTTALLGAALTLARFREQNLLTRPVRLVFQPAEEVQPGGALVAMRDGLLGDGEVESLHMLHCDPTKEVGRIGVLDGPITSGTDTFHFHAEGKGGHGARPHLTANVPAALIRMANALLAIPSRFAPRDGVVISTPVIHTGHARNIIDPRGELGGTMRTADPEAWERIGAIFAEHVEAAKLASGSGVTWTQMLHRMPPVVNSLGYRSREAIVDLFGEEAVVDTEQSQGGEDGAWYLKGVSNVPGVPDMPGVPGNLVRLGVRSRGVDPESAAHLHEGDFDVDEEAIGVGAAYLTRMATASMVDLTTD
ncbi:amidohydrolase [Embleya sp. NPDC020630]|uniref:amidohydrolase n=1 Tax=Embleya sp. NPDC020630 TaxID=3363979 RepID=UPI0037BAB34F